MLSNRSRTDRLCPMLFRCSSNAIRAEASLLKAGPSTIERQCSWRMDEARACYWGPGLNGTDSATCASHHLGLSHELQSRRHAGRHAAEHFERASVPSGNFFLLPKSISARAGGKHHYILWPADFQTDELKCLDTTKSEFGQMLMRQFGQVRKRA